MEAEYVALSSSMKELIPVINMVKDVYTAIGLGNSDEIVINSTLWEDNSGELTLAKLEPPRMTPRSKHYALKYHWFRSKVSEYGIKLMKISSEFQLADMLTKALGKINLQRLRKLFMGR